MFILEQSAHFCAKLLTFKAEFACRVLLFLLGFNILVARARRVWKGLICGTKCWTMRFGNLQLVGKLRELAFDSQRTAAERTRNDEAHQVIPNHLTHILRDMIEQLGMQWKEKSITIVALPYTEYKAGDAVEIFSNKGRRWVLACGGGHGGSWLMAGSRSCSEASLWHRISKGNSLFFAKKALLCDPKVPVKRRIHAFYSTCVAAVLHGAGEWDTLSLCPRRSAFGSWAKLRRTILGWTTWNELDLCVPTLAMRRVQSAAWPIIRSQMTRKVAGRAYCMAL